MTLPVIHELVPAPAVADAFRALADRQGVVLFDSSLQRGNLGRYSFLTAEPFELFSISQPEFGKDPFEQVASRLQEFHSTSVPEFPPFQGGAAGLLTYELGRCFERLPALVDEFQIPVATIGLYSWVLAWDHQRQRCWYIGHGYPETTERARAQLAQSQYESIRRTLSSPLMAPSAQTTTRGVNTTVRLNNAGQSLDLLPGLLSNFSREEYLQAVQQVIDLIHAGDIFQANLSQRLLFPAQRSAVEQYLILRKQNPATFAGYLSHDNWAVMSSSPERFLKLESREVSTRPIKGTRGRRSIPEADLFAQDELRESHKDRSENVMIVDLLRNDLSRVCKPGSLRVPELCTVEVYETVSHLVSEVRGILREECSFWDLLSATFPGGSITGAPKIRAMEIISELEQVTRGPYCGSLFYLGFDGTADSNILIRTMTQRDGWITFSAGGGIVSRSNPRDEYEETLHKARGMLNSLQPFR